MSFQYVEYTFFENEALSFILSCVREGKGRKFLLNFLNSLDKAKLAWKKILVQDKQNHFKA